MLSGPSHPSTLGGFLEIITFYILEDTPIILINLWDADGERRVRVSERMRD